MIMHTNIDAWRHDYTKVNNMRYLKLMVILGLGLVGFSHVANGAELQDSFDNLNNWTLVSSSNPAAIEGAAMSGTSETRIINVRDHGAIADGGNHVLSSMHATQAAVDLVYGAGKYTLVDQIDFVAINEAILLAKQNANEHLAEGANGTWAVYMPTGVYKINRTINLSSTYGLKLYGAGRSATRLSFTTASDLFYIESGGHMVFRDFSVESTVASNATAFHFHNQSSGGLTGPTFKFLLDNIIVDKFFRALYATGDTMCSELTFVYCRFTQCLTGLHLNNVQALNYSFFGCDFEFHDPSGTVYPPYSAINAVVIKAEQGGCVNLYGGSILLHGTTLLLDKPVGVDGINMISGMYNFNGVTWEQWTPSGKPLIFDSNNEIMRARVNIDNCRVYQKDGTAGQDIGILTSGVVVTISNSNFHSAVGLSHPPKIQLYIDANTEDFWGSLLVDNSKWLEVYETRHGSVSAKPNVHHKVSFTNSATRSNDHFATGGSQKINEMDFDISPLDAMPSVRIKRIYYREAAGTLSSGTIFLDLPEHAILNKIGVVKSSTETATYTVTNDSGGIAIGTLQTNASTTKDTIDNIELSNNGTGWDGSIKIQASASGSGYIYVEYF